LTQSPSEVAIVTGASAGIGSAVARKLAQDGFQVVLAARRRERLQKLEQDIIARGGTALAIPTDVTRLEDCQRLVQKTMMAYGRIDVLVNNAGFGYRSPLEYIPLEAIRHNFETNLFGPIALTQLVIPIMRAQQKGYIVNVSSVAGRIARPLSSVYDATKHAIEAISDSLRAELAHFGIRIIVIEPGFIKTEFLGVARTESAPFWNNDRFYSELMKTASSKDERFRRLAKEPELFAALVSSVVRNPNPRFRYAAPGSARLALWLKRMLPERLFQRLFT
jgi:NAD(P)-dependent dehydrogenase (short-subunit alcohol dehydrogenase family)